MFRRVFGRVGTAGNFGTLARDAYGDLGLEVTAKARALHLLQRMDANRSLSAPSEWIAPRVW